MPEAFEKIKKCFEEKAETYKNIRRGTYCRRTETDDCDSCRADHYLDARLSTIKDLIEIVNQEAEEFGISEQVCEWKPGKVSDNWCPSCEPNSTYTVWGVAWFRKCPYCGKKIKVVE